MYIIRPPPMSTRLTKASARACQRASEGDKNQQFHEDVFHGCSPFAFNSPARCPATSTNHTHSFSIGRGAETLMQINCEINDHGMPGQSVETQAGLLFVAVFGAASPAGR